MDRPAQPQDPFAILEEPISVPEAAVRVDLEETIKKLLIRAGKLESTLELSQQQATAKMRSLLLGLLDVADALDRLLAPGTPTTPHTVVVSPGEGPVALLERQRKSVETTRKLLLKRLNQVGVVEMQLLGTLADPMLSEIEEWELHPSLPDETVLEETRHGYWWNDEVLRQARVVVSRQS